MTFAQVWNDMQSRASPPPFMLIDCAGIVGGRAALPEAAFDELVCLFTGELAEEAADVAPYLARFGSFGAEQLGVAEDLIGRQIGTLVLLPRMEDESSAFGVLHRHFRTLNVVYGPDSRPLFFRYYDPRVLVDVLSVFDPTQLKAFFGQVESFVIMDHAHSIRRCSCADGVLRIT